MSELPKGWAVTHAIEIAKPIRGVTYKKEQSRDTPALEHTPVLRANNIQKDKVNLSDLVYVPDECISVEQRLIQNDIVIAMSSGSASVVGKTAQIVGEINASFGAFCGTLRPCNLIDPRYLGHFLKSDAYRSRISELARGVNINNLKWSHFEEIGTPLAPFPEQKRIADKLDTLLARIDACRDRLDRIPKIIKQFRQSVLAAATSGRLTEDWRAAQADRVARMQPQAESGLVARDAAQCRYEVTPTPDSDALAQVCIRKELHDTSTHNFGGLRYQEAPTPEGASVLPIGWHWVAVGTLASKVADGVHKKPHYVSSGIPFITVKNLTAGNGISFAETNFITESDHIEFCRRTPPEKGDLLVTKDGTLGVVRLIETDVVFSIFVSVALIKLHDKRMSR
jgi:type I restriction enzyme S subunit